MKRRLLYIFAALAVLSLVPYGCGQKEDNPQQKEDPQQPEDPDTPLGELDPITLNVPVTDNWIFHLKPNLLIQLENPNNVDVEATVTVRFTSDFKEDKGSVEKTVKVPAKCTLDVPITTEVDFEPGFYKAKCSLDGYRKKTFNFGVDPLGIVSAPDMQADFHSFWEWGVAQLKDIDMNIRMTELEKKSSADCKVYLVEFDSVPDGLEGDPVTVRGYYLEPQDGKKHPVLLHFYGYDSQTPGVLSCPYGGSKPTYTELYFSHRGQYINNRPASKREPDGHGDFVNPYGDWFAYNFGDKNSYYYRGAYLDCAQAVRFMATRETSDMNNLFAEGSSQGGALTYAAAALSDYPFSAIACNVAFMGDFPDYFRIVDWPANVAKANKGSMTDEEMYKFLSYFDTKNMVNHNPTYALYATSGLEDATCPSHTNVAPFNNLPVEDKEMHFYPKMTHDYPSTWTSDIDKFFKAHMK